MVLICPFASLNREMAITKENDEASPHLLSLFHFQRQMEHAPFDALHFDGHDRDIYIYIIEANNIQRVTTSTQHNT